mmetsp:Transcript_20843/g.47003  ORF Transcript_20843/g.47003 Transcript_20843/m.47003 type:complete len:226 (+) Transcript_20843:430-1107(+)
MGIDPAAEGFIAAAGVPQRTAPLLPGGDGPGGGGGLVAREAPNLDLGPEGVKGDRRPGCCRRAAGRLESRGGGRRAWSEPPGHHPRLRGPLHGREGVIAAEGRLELFAGQGEPVVQVGHRVADGPERQYALGPRLEDGARFHQAEAAIRRAIHGLSQHDRVPVKGLGIRQIPNPHIALCQNHKSPGHIQGCCEIHTRKKLSVHVVYYDFIVLAQNPIKLVASEIR